VSEPKFLSTKAVAAQVPAKKRIGRPPSGLPKKSAAAVKREQRAAQKMTPQARKPPQAPAGALADLREAWSSAQASHLAGTPVDSPVGQLILDQLERTEARAAPARAAIVVLDADGDRNPQDELVQRHRTDIAETRRLVMSLITELDQMIRMEDLFVLIADLCEPVNDKGQIYEKSKRLRSVYFEMISMPSRTDLALKLANALRALVPLERQAAGIPDDYVDAETERKRKEQTTTSTVVATSYDAIMGRFQQIMLKVQQGAVPST
jgi:hypothetical protein